MKKKVDHLGRIGIPKPIREEMALNDDTLLSIDYDSAKKIIILKKEADSCIACGSTKELLKIRSVFLCKNCLNQLNNI